MRISDWSSDVCSSDLKVPRDPLNGLVEDVFAAVDAAVAAGYVDPDRLAVQGQSYGGYTAAALVGLTDRFKAAVAQAGPYNLLSLYGTFDERSRIHDAERSEEHTSELQSLMRISYAVFCLKKKRTHTM